MPTPLVIYVMQFVLDLEFEGHAVGMWKRNLAPENQNHSWCCHYGEEIMIVGRTVWGQSTSVTDGQIYDD